MKRPTQAQLDLLAHVNLGFGMGIIFTYLLMRLL
jgi:hypothetical protein